MTTSQKQFISTDGAWQYNRTRHPISSPAKTLSPLHRGLFCPFAHRVNLIRHLKGLTSFIFVSIVKPYPKGDSKCWPGWKFPKIDDEYPDATVDHVFGSEYLHEIYFKANKDYEGRYSVPVLWDKQTNTIVGNESLEILRFLQTGFDTLLEEPHKSRNYYPAHHQSQIEEIGKWMQDDLNMGVYKAGFALSQETYDKSFIPVFQALNKLEKIVAQNWSPYILGQEMTELDLRLFPTLIRFDTVYVQHFKCNLGTIRHDYPLLNNWLKNLYWNVEGLKETTDFRHIKENYTKSHGDINPRAITPMGPFPRIEKGVENDWGRLEAGCVDFPS